MCTWQGKSAFGPLSEVKLMLISPLILFDDELRLRLVSRQMRNLVDSQLSEFIFSGPMAFRGDDSQACAVFLNKLPMLRTLRVAGAFDGGKARALANVSRIMPLVRCLHAREWKIDGNFRTLNLREGLHLRPAVVMDLHEYLDGGEGDLAANALQLLGDAEPEPLVSCTLVVDPWISGPATEVRAMAISEKPVRTFLKALGAAATSVRVTLANETDALALSLAPAGFALGPRCTHLDVGCIADYDWGRRPVEHAALARALSGCIPSVQRLQLVVNTQSGQRLPVVYTQALRALPDRMRSVTLEFFDTKTDEVGINDAITAALDALPRGLAAARLSICEVNLQCSVPPTIVREPLIRAHAAAGTLWVGVAIKALHTLRALIDTGCRNLCLFAEFGSRWGPDYQKYQTLSAAIASAVEQPSNLRRVKMEVWDRGGGEVLLGARLFEAPARACEGRSIAFECKIMENPVV